MCRIQITIPDNRNNFILYNNILQLKIKPTLHLHTKSPRTLALSQNIDLSPQATPEPESTTPFIDPRPTWRPRRENCSPPAIEQFPRPLMGPNARKHGGLIIHLLVAVYTFLGLAIVCDDYFVASLDRICEGEFLIFVVVAKYDG